MYQQVFDKNLVKNLKISTKISFQFDELFKIKFPLTDSRFLLKTFQTKLAGTFPGFFYHGLLIFPALICFKASLLLNGFNWCVATKSSTHLELILAYSRNAQPIAFCTKNSLEFEWGMICWLKILSLVKSFLLNWYIMDVLFNQKLSDLFHSGVTDLSKSSGSIFHQ